MNLLKRLVFRLVYLTIFAIVFRFALTMAILHPLRLGISNQGEVVQKLNKYSHYP